MAFPSYAPFVVGPQYCVPYPIQIVMVKKPSLLRWGEIMVTDLNNNIMLTVKVSPTAVHQQRLILDAAGYPILTLRQKLLSEHSRWQVFRGDSKNMSDLLFSTKTPLIRMKNLNVYLANNHQEKIPDFVVEGTWLERNCTIRTGDSSSILAQMRKDDTLGRELLGKDKFIVYIYPNVDYAFTVALIVILDILNTNRWADVAFNTGDIIGTVALS